MSSEAVRDLMIEIHAAVVELQAEVAVVATRLGKVSNNLDKLKAAVCEEPCAPPEKRGAECHDEHEEREHKRLKALFQKRGMTTTMILGSAWDPDLKGAAGPGDLTIPAVVGGNDGQDGGDEISQFSEARPSDPISQFPATVVANDDM